MKHRMHIRPFIPMFLASLAVFSLAPQCRANWFSKGQPVPQWGMDAYKTPTPANTGDATAVILYDEYVETIDAQGRAIEREREAIRILKPQGRGNTCEITFNEDEKVNYFRAWTITPDQKTFQAMDTDFAEVGETNVPIMLSTDRHRIVHPPAVDVGTTIVCETEEVMAPYEQEKMWGIQNGIPVVFQALEIDLPDARPITSSWHNTAAVAPVQVAPNHWRWEVKDMTALDLRDIPSRPEWVALSARMDVQWGSAAVKGTDAQWAALGQKYTDLEAHRTDPSPEITAQTQKLIAGSPNPYSTMSRITDYVQKNFRYFIVMRGIGGWQANPAAQIFHNRYGDCKDKSTMLISMLEVAGIHAHYVLVDDRRGAVSPEMPSFYGDHMITAIEIPAGVDDKRFQALVTAKNGTRYLIFDPTDEHTPVGNLRSDLQGSYGILSTGASSQLIQLPVLPPDANGTTRTGAFALAADGTLTGSVDEAHTGPEGADLRMLLKYTDQKEQHDYWERKISGDVPGSTVDSFTVSQPSELDKPLALQYKISASGYAHNAGPLVLVRSRVVGSDSLAFNDRERTVPIDLGATGHWHDSFEIAIPPGFIIDETPDPIDLDLDFASYHSSVSAKGATLHYERDYQLRQVQLPAARAKDFIKLESAILTDERSNSVLRKADTTAQQTGPHN